MPSGILKEFLSTKTYVHAGGLSCCFRQWRAQSHCNQLHGYALQVKLTFRDTLDERNWVQDFGGLKDVKEWLTHMFDHTTLVAVDDPQRSLLEQLDAAGVADVRIVAAVGCERFAELIFDQVLHMGFTSLIEVEVREHESNSAICRAKDLIPGVVCKPA